MSQDAGGRIEMDPRTGLPLGLISPAGWDQLVQSVGQGPEGWRCHQLYEPLGRARNTLLRVVPPTGGDGYVLKIYRNDTADRAGEQIAGLWSGLRRLADHPTARIPMIYAVAPKDDAILMEYVPGWSLQDVLTDPQAAPVRIGAVEVCARWLRANMEAGTPTQIPLPVGIFNQRLARLADHRGGVWEGEAFARLAVLTEDGLGRVPTRALPAGARHGDANPGNFIINPEGVVYGIDLLRPVNQHLCQDLAYLLVRSLPYLMSEMHPLAALSQLAQRLRNVLELTEDMAVATTLFLRLEVLGLWRRVPAADFQTDKPDPNFLRALVAEPDLDGLRI